MAPDIVTAEEPKRSRKQCVFSESSLREVRRFMILDPNIRSGPQGPCQRGVDLRNMLYEFKKR